LFGNSLFLTLFALSLVRLEIALSPFRFQSQNHTHVLIMALLLILGVPMGETVMRFLVQGQIWDCSTIVIIKGSVG
jgi:hypothetical protein